MNPFAMMKDAKNMEKNDEARIRKIYEGSRICKKR